MTAIKMVHVTATSFHVNLYADKSYLIDVDTPPPETQLIPSNSESWKMHWYVDFK